MTRPLDGPIIGSANTLPLRAGPPSIHSMASNTPDIEVLRDRVIRASEVRASIGMLWNEYMERQPRRFRLVANTESDTRWTFVINTTEPMPVRISTLFGEWLYLLRAALDGTAYYVAVRDSGQNPPPNERSIYFPIKTDPAKYDSQGHRQGLIALSDSTFADLRIVQPFNAQPDYKSNVLWWIEELARIDRHRYGHTLAPAHPECADRTETSDDVGKAPPSRANDSASAN